VNDPRKSKKTLGQPNYYRLGYHLAAHQVHADRARVHGTSPGDDLSRFAIKKPIPDPGQLTEQLVADATSMIEWFRERRRLRRNRLRKVYVAELRPDEQRLLAFLDKTIRPCAEILLAAIERKPDRVERVKRIEQVLQDSPTAVTYRAVYNLACWNAEDPNAPPDQPNESALRYLHQALTRAPRARAPELARWAHRDPTLQVLDAGASSADFQAVLAEFPWPEPESRTEKDAEKDADKDDEKGKRKDEDGRKH
jgi:hypothetical protein